MKLDANMIRTISATTATETSIKKIERKLETVTKTECYKLADGTPAGGALFTYFIAILTYLGAFTVGRKVVSEDAVRAFFSSITAITYHAKEGRIERGPRGMRLTAQGLSYFQGRISGKTKNQLVLQEEVDAMIEAIKTGNYPTVTKNFSPKTRFRKIEIEMI